MKKGSRDRDPGRGLASGQGPADDGNGFRFHS